MTTSDTEHRKKMTAWRVQLANATGLTSGPMFADRCWTWDTATTASCTRHPTGPVPECSCGIYATDSLEALAPVVEVAQEMVDAAARSPVAPGGPWPYVIARSADTLLLTDRRTAVVVLRGTLVDAVPSGSAPLRLLPVRRSQLLPFTQRWFTPPGLDLDEVLFRAAAEHTDPAGTWRGARFVTKEVHTVGRPAPWLADLVAPLPVLALTRSRLLGEKPQAKPRTKARGGAR